MSKLLDKDYWNSRYLKSDTPWDIGEVAKPLKLFFDSLPEKSIQILIPGAGRGHEAAYLFDQGFPNVFVCDWAEEAFHEMHSSYPDFPTSNLLIDDFFNLVGQYDLIVEQTFFCALNPSLRADYVKKTAELLRPNGELAGLLFAIHFPFEGPPFGGDREEYFSLFSPQYEILDFELSPNSILPRMGNECFFRMKIDKTKQ